MANGIDNDQDDLTENKESTVRRPRLHSRLQSGKSSKSIIKLSITILKTKIFLHTFFNKTANGCFFFSGFIRYESSNLFHECGQMISRE